MSKNKPCDLCDDPVWIASFEQDPSDVPAEVHQIIHATNTVAHLQHIARHLAELVEVLKGKSAS